MSTAMIRFEFYDMFFNNTCVRQRSSGMIYYTRSNTYGQCLSKYGLVELDNLMEVETLQLYCCKSYGEIYQVYNTVHTVESAASSLREWCFFFFLIVYLVLMDMSCFRLGFGQNKICIMFGVIQQLYCIRNACVSRHPSEGYSCSSPEALRVSGSRRKFLQPIISEVVLCDTLSKMWFVNVTRKQQQLQQYSSTVYLDGCCSLVLDILVEQYGRSCSAKPDERLHKERTSTSKYIWLHTKMQAPRMSPRYTS